MANCCSWGQWKGKWRRSQRGRGHGKLLLMRKVKKVTTWKSSLQIIAHEGNGKENAEGHNVEELMTNYCS